MITGAARGIGRAIAQELAGAGAQVVVVDLDAELAAEVARALPGPGHAAAAVDVTSAAAVQAAVERIEREQGPIDVLVNNAGIMSLGGFLDQPPGRDGAQQRVNLDGVIHGMRAVLPFMLARRRGHVVNVASVAGRIGTPFAAVYSATKFAVIGLTEAVRAELDGQGVRFTYVMPALVDTELIAGAGRPAWPPVASPEDVARAVHDALLTGKVDVYVPRVARLSAVIPALLPRAVYERLGRLFRVDRMFASIDEGARAGYAARLSGARTGPAAGGAVRTRPSTPRGRGPEDPSGAIPVTDPADRDR